MTARRDFLRACIVAGSIALALAACGSSDQRTLILATTTSTRDTGLLDSLLPPFTDRTGIVVKVIAVGTGAALEMARRGDADAVLVHAPDLERTYAARGDIVAGRRVMHNEFVLLGPPDDPADAASADGLLPALRAVASGGTFISRGDGSGTEILELALWQAAGVRLDSMARREETGQGMGATLLLADERRAYTLSDDATYTALRNRVELVPIFRGDSLLDNVYRVWIVNPDRHPSVPRREARAFVHYLVSDAAQALIGRFGAARFGRPLYIADAEVVDADRAR